MPKVYDGEGFVQGPCKHPILFFGGGGYLVICSICSTQWQMVGNNFAEIDLNEDDEPKDDQPII